MSTAKTPTRVTPVIKALICVVIGLALMFLFLSKIQSDYAMKRQQSNSQTQLATAAQTMVNNATDADDDWAVYDEFIIQKVDAVGWLLDTLDEDVADLAEIAEQWDLCVVYLTDATGKVTESIGGSAKTLDEAGLSRLLAYQRGEDTHAFVTIDNICYYLSVREDGSFVVGGVESSEMIVKQDERFTAAYSLRDISVGETGYIIAIALEDNTVAYTRDESLIGQDASVLGIDKALDAGYSGWVSIDGQDWYAENLECSADGDPYLLIAVIQRAEITATTMTSVWCAVTLCAIAMILMVIYTALLHIDVAQGRLSEEVRYQPLGKKHFINMSIMERLRPVMSICVVIVIIVVAYVQCLSAVSRQEVISESKLAGVVDLLESNDARIEELTENYSSEYSKRAQDIAWSLALDSSLINDDVLSEFAEKAQIQGIYVFNSKGTVIATNSVYKDFVLSSNEEDQSYPFWDVIKGYTDLLVQEAMPDDATGEIIQYVGVARIDASGMVQIGMEPSLLADRLQTTTIDHVLGNVSIEDEGIVFAVNADDGSFAYFLSEKYVGRSAADYGLSEGALSDDYIGWQTLNGESYFVMSVEHGDYYIYVAVPTANLFGNVFIMTLLTALAAAIIILILMAVTTIVPAGTTKVDDDDSVEVAPVEVYEVTMADGRRQRTVPAAVRWSGKLLNFDSLDATGRLMRIIGIIVAIASLVLLAIVFFGVADRNSLMSFILSLRWEHVPNLFSITYVIIAVFEILVVAAIIRIVIVQIACSTSSRGETIGRMLNSFIKYVAVIAAIFYGLQFFGIDSTTLLASAGILTLIIGLGAQSLVNDILAGMFIVFEGDFRVGDIVTISGWRGTVQEIGIRTTKIKDAGNDIKIFRNSEISGVINQTRQYSYAISEVGIEYGESIERVEAVLNAEFENMRKHLPEIIEGPFYKGVVELGDSSVVIRLIALCKETARAQLQRDLNREIKLIFDRYDIGIPFPQIVLNQAKEKAAATDEEQRIAAEFVEEQRATAPQQLAEH